MGKDGFPLQDWEIVQLYWDRDERAIAASAEKYGRYCTSIAARILSDSQDVEECVSDTFWRAWNAIPPHRPALLSAFFGKITRNLSCSRYRRNTAHKRGGGALDAVLEELSGIVSGADSVEQQADYRALIAASNAFLGGLSAEKRGIFLCRYWYFDRIPEIAARYGKSENHVSVILNRLRAKLRAYLLERGFTL